MKKKTIEFFMMLTNRSIYLAHYTIRSYVKVYVKMKSEYDIQLTIYLNAINYSKYQSEIDEFEKYPFVKLIKSASRKDDFVFNGKHYVSKSNGFQYTLPMERMSEGQDIAYANFESDYFVTVDDDLEILKPDFIVEMIRIMEANPDLGIFSTDKTITHSKYDYYSSGNIVAMERNDTWFCMYKKKSKVTGCSMELVDKFVDNLGNEYTWSPKEIDNNWDAYFKIVNENEGIRYVWDGGALLQERIRSKFKHKVIALTDVDMKYSNQFIHYAAFGKNVSVNTPLKVAIYRILFIGSFNGLLFLPDSLNKYVRKICRKINKILFKNAYSERLIPTVYTSLD